MKSNALDSWQYGDPAKVLERKQEASCKGCQFEEWDSFGGPDVLYCSKGRKHGAKCRAYKERN